MPRASDIVLRIRPDYSPQDADMVCVERGSAAVRLRRLMDALARRTRAEERSGRGPPTHDLFGFLATEANAIVAPIHSKAMPVILTTTQEFDLWQEGEVEALKLRRPLPNDALRIVARAKRRMRPRNGCPRLNRVTTHSPDCELQPPGSAMAALTSKPVKLIGFDTVPRKRMTALWRSPKLRFEL
jgi:hypothetical protein